MIARASVLLLFVLSILAAPLPSRADSSILDKSVDIETFQQQFVYRDRTGQPRIAWIGALPAAMAAALPKGVNLSKSLLTAGQDWHQFEKLWCGDQTGNNCTSDSLLTKDCGVLTQGIAAAINKIGDKQDNTAYNFQKCQTMGYVALNVLESATQAMQPGAISFVPGHSLQIDFLIPRNWLVFSVTTSTTCKDASLTCPQDPQFTFVYDIAIHIVLSSNDPTQLSCPFTINAWQTITDEGVIAGDGSASLNAAAQAMLKTWSSSNSIITEAGTGAAGGGVLGAALAVYTADMVSGLKVALTGILNFISDDVTNKGLPSLVLNNIRYVLPEPIDPYSLDAFKDLKDFAAGCGNMKNLGFTQFDAAANDQIFVTVFTHPDGAPALANATPVAAQNLFQPKLVGSVPEIQSGKILTVTGENFVSTQTKVSWVDPTYVPVVESDLSYRKSGTTSWKDIVLPRKGNYDNANSYSPTDLVAGTSYDFQVRDCDEFTCTQYQAQPLTVRTAGGAAASVVLYLDSIAPAQRLAAADVTANGTFSVQVPIGAKVAPGNHNIIAALANATTPAGTPLPLKVIAPGQTLTRQIQIEDSKTHDVVNQVLAMQKFDVQGTGFSAGSVVLTFANQKNPLGTVPVPPNGSFHATVTAPMGLSGNQTLVATETVNGKPVITKSTIYVQAPPQ